MKGILVIRKYKNRRLYDTEKSHHITRADLLETIRSGRDVQVQEASTGEDVTVETLLQLMQSDKGIHSHMMPSEFLHFLIRSDENVLHRFFRDFLPGAMQAFQSSFSGMRQRQQRVAQSFFPFTGFGNPWLMPWANRNEDEEQEQERERDEEVEALRQQVEDLKAELANASSKKTRK